jgi:hypothetical protein
LPARPPTGGGSLTIGCKRESSIRANSERYLQHGNPKLKEICRGFGQRWADGCSDAFASERLIADIPQQVERANKLCQETRN